MVVIPLVVFSIFYVWTYHIPSIRTILSIADFHGYGSIDEFHIGANIRQKLRFATNTKKDQNINFRSLSKTFTEQQRPTVISEGKQQKATILIWGWYNEIQEEKGTQLGINSLFELLKPPLDFSKVGEEIKAVNEQGVWTLPPLSHQLTLTEVNTQFNSLLSEMTYLTLFTIGLGHYKAGQSEKTIEHFDTAINRFDAALEQIKDIEQPKSKLDESFVHYYRSNALFYKALFSKSGVYYDRAINGFTKAIELTPSYSSYTSFNFGYINANQQTYNLVLTSYTPISRSNSGLDEIDSTQDIICTNQKRTTHVLVNDSASQLRAYLARIYNNRGVAYAMKGDNDKALADYAQAVLLDSEIDEVCNNLGVIYTSQGKYKSAIRNYEQAIFNDDNAEDAFAYNNRGNAYAYDGDYEQAIKDYKKAIELKPNFTEAYYNRGAVYLFNKRSYDSAIPDFNQAIQLNPDFDLAYFSRGLAYTYTGQESNAINDLQKTVSLTTKPVLRLYAKRQLQRIEGVNIPGESSSGIYERVNINQRFPSNNPLNRRNNFRQKDRK